MYHRSQGDRVSARSSGDVSHDVRLTLVAGLGCLTFDSTRISAADVDFPIDIVLYARDSFKIVEHRYEKEELFDISDGWQERLRREVNSLPAEWLEHAFSKLSYAGNHRSAVDHAEQASP